jgi:hypothetical protein|tara:strand:+ start:795 stop:1046 length:252 start_codon:yes stop_codon:yes gene_type:complete
MKKNEDYEKEPQPKYYKGNVFGYTVKDIVDDFELGSWTAQAVQYILRAGKKQDNTAQQDIQKAINVLQFELERIYKKSKNGVI